MSFAKMGSSLLGYGQLQEDYYNVCQENYTDPVNEGTSVITILSSFFSIVGSLLIIITFFAFREIRTIGRAILVFLAVADFFTAAGYIFGAAVYLHYSPEFDSYKNLTSSYVNLCEAQSFITTVFPISSFLWTTNLAVYLFVAIVLRKLKWAKKMLVVFHVTAWGIPLLICIPALAAGKLGPAQSHSSASWCWVKFDPSQPSQLPIFYVLELFCGKFWEITTCIIALLLCGIVKYTIFKRSRKAMTETTTYGFSSIEKKMKAAFFNVDQKLIWIPLIFLLVRIWGTLRFFISLDSHCRHPCHINANETVIVVLPQCEKVLYHPALVYLQSIGDPGQGWSNALLYVIFHRPIAKRLFPCWFVCWKRFSYWLGRCQRRCMICKVRRRTRTVDNSPPSSTAQHTPDTSRDSHYNDREPLVRKAKSGSKTSYDCESNSVKFYSVDEGSAVVDNVSINEQVDTSDS